MSSSIWTFPAGAATQVAPSAAIAVPTPTVGTLQGQAGQILTLLDSLDPARGWLAAAGYYVEHRVGTDAGYGWRVPTIGTDGAGRPAAVRTPQAAPADTRTVGEIADERRAAVTIAAEAAQISAAGGYGWPESADWHGLEVDARAYLATRDAQTPTVGRSLLADVGSAEPAALLAGANRVVAKADQFRVARGHIVRHRRALHAQIDAAAAADDRDTLIAIDPTAGWAP